MEPSYQVALCNFNDEPTTEKELFRNTLINKCKLIDSQKFNSGEFSFKFKTVPDSQNPEPIDLCFTRNDFTEIEGQAAESLIKSAAYQDLDKLSGEDKVKMSVKYQVLCDATAIIGVMKQTDNVSGELQETTIKFGKEKQFIESDSDSDECDFLMGAVAPQYAMNSFGGAKRSMAPPSPTRRMMHIGAAPKRAMRRSASSSDESEEEEECKDDDDDLDMLCDSGYVAEKQSA